MRSTLHSIRRPFHRSVVLLTTLLSLAFAAHAQIPPSSILQPSGVAFDAAGNLYFADASRNQVFESSLAGTLILIAGNGTQGFAGDGSSATAALLNHPQSVAVDSSGTLYIADTGNHRIRSISSGIITTFAGNGTAAYSGDNGSAIAAALHTPTAIALPLSGALLVCDTGNHRIRSISTGIITTFAGNGSQGFSGDNGPATAAQLDSPSGVAIAPDGRVFVADTHNDRIRLISTTGTVTTIAGTGTRGYGGDKGPAINAHLALPRGLTLTSAGNLLFADSNNQRIRQIDQQGIITTLAGNGTQGSIADAAPGTSATLDTPRSVAVSTFGSPTFTDVPSHTLHELVAAANLYRPAGLTAPPRTTTVTLRVPTASYGQTTAITMVSGAAGIPQGTVQLLRGSIVISTTQLISGNAIFPLSVLPAGSYTLTAAYAGDGVNPAASSSPVAVTVGQAIATATANAATTTWSQSIPALTGSLTGILPQDAPHVAVTFLTAATQLSSPGIYPITAILTGSASSQYTLQLSPYSGALQILKEPTTATTQALAQTSYAGLPLILSAAITANSATPSSPSGTVSFLDNGALISTTLLARGSATTVFSSPTAGNHSIVASYSGDTDFAPSTSAAVTASVGIMPDFAITNAGSSSQTVAAGSIATYNLLATSQSGPFTGVVSFSVNGLPNNAIATFTPSQVVPGASSATTVLAIQTPAVKVQLIPNSKPGSKIILFAMLLFPGFLFCTSVQRRMRSKFLFSLTIAATFLSGCGDRTVPVGELNATTYNLTITGTSTNLAGVTVSHSVHVALLVN